MSEERVAPVTRTPVRMKNNEGSIRKSFRNQFIVYKKFILNVGTWQSFQMPPPCSFILVDFKSSPIFSSSGKVPGHFPCLVLVYRSLKLLTYLPTHANVPGASWDVSVTHSLHRYLLSFLVPRCQVLTVPLSLSRVSWSIHGTPKP